MLGLRLSAPSSAYAGTNGSNGVFGGAGGPGSNPGTNDGGAGPWNAPGGSGGPAGGGGAGGAVNSGGTGGTSLGGGRGADGGAYGQAGWLVGGGGGAGGGFASLGEGGGGGGGGSAYAAATNYTCGLFCTFGGSGGGGGGGLGKEVAGSYVNAGAISGGNGGSGGPVTNLLSCNNLSAGDCSGGGGGGGGAGILLDASAVLTNSGYIHGGSGSNGQIGRHDSGPLLGAGIGGRGGGGAGLLMSAGSNVTNAGNIRGGNGGTFGSTTNGGYGGTGVSAAGNATIVNAGSIAGGNGANAVALTGGGNTLELNAGYAFSGNVVSDGSGAGDALALGGAGNAVFNLSKVGSLYQGFARDTKTGTSTWTATNAATQAMIWSIDAGTLELDGSLPVSGSAIAVNGGGTLSGTGSLTGNLSAASGATVMPGTGGTSGVLTIAGNIAENAGSTLLIHADNAGHSSGIAVTSGTATLGGTLDMAFTAAPAQGQVYPVLAGNISGKFASVTATGLGAGNGLYVVYGSVTVSIGPSLGITSPASATFQDGQPGSFAMTKLNPDFPVSTCGESGALPAGVLFDASTCTLFGTPGAGTAGNYPIVLKTSNGVDPDVTQNFALTVFPPFAITSPNSTTFEEGKPGSFAMTKTNVPPSTCSESGPLPAGVTFDPSTCTLSGTPAAGAAGTYSIVLKASNGLDPDITQNFTLKVFAPLAITSPNSTTFEEGKAGSFAMTKTNVPPSTCSESGPLPAGVTFDPSTCTLSGTPAPGTAGPYSIVFKASNGVDPDVTQNFALAVLGPPKPVPTLSGKMLALLGALIAACAAFFDPRRRSDSSAAGRRRSRD